MESENVHYLSNSVLQLSKPLTFQRFDQLTDIHVQLTRNLDMIVTHISFNEESTQPVGFARSDPSHVHFQSHIR